MDYLEKLEKLNAELRSSGATPDSMRDLFMLQLNTEKMRIAGEELEFSQNTTRRLVALKEEAELRAGLIHIGSQDPDAAEELMGKLNELMIFDMAEKLKYQSLNAFIEAKLLILSEADFIKDFAKGELGDNLDEAFSIYAKKYDTLGALELRSVTQIKS